VGCSERAHRKNGMPTFQCLALREVGVLALRQDTRLVSSYNPLEEAIVDLKVHPALVNQPNKIQC
jgi:hypothetical protein